MECVQRCVGVCMEVGVGRAWGRVSRNLHGKKECLFLPFFFFLFKSEYSDTNVPSVFGTQRTVFTASVATVCPDAWLLD